MMDDHYASCREADREIQATKAREKSQGTVYNVTHDLTSWARERVSLWDARQRAAIREVFEELDRAEHGARCEERRKKNNVNT